MSGCRKDDYMKEKIRGFFAGRNGVDSLSSALLWGSLLVMLLSKLTNMGILYYLSWAGIIYAYYRILSRDVYRRQAENGKYVAWKGQLRQRWQQRGTHRFYRCPKCRTVLRVPKGKGKINITCRSCGEKFIRKT